MTVARSDSEVLVIGGGPAGSMLAIRLASGGRRVTLIERESVAHDKVCGEFLSREAIHYLQQTGIDPLALGAHVIRTIRLSSGNTVVSAPLPFQAFSLSRRTLDEALLLHAAEHCDVIRGVAVASLTADGETWSAQLNDGKSIRASAAFLATGKHDLRGFARPAGRQGDLIGFKMLWRLEPAQIETLRHHMDLYLFPSGYGGLSLIENDDATLCFVVRRSILRAQGAWPAPLDAVFATNRHLRQLLHGAQPLWPRPLAISPIPYGFLAASPRGPWCVGDQAAVIPSFTGDGISIALHSAALAAEMFLAGGTVSEFQRTLNSQLNRSMILATTLSRGAVTGLGRTAAAIAVSLFPRVMHTVARATRIPEAALLGRQIGHTSLHTPPGNLPATPQPH